MRYWLSIMLMLGFWPAYAQLDTLLLEGVEVRGIPIEKYAVGQKVVRFDSTTLFEHHTQNLSSALAGKASLYMKSYGSNMASTIALRGTGPSHTAVFWNGLEISSITLGQTDFSLIPVYASDELSVLYGSASSLFGSGAIGGVVNLQTTPQWGDEVDVEVTNNYGSFDTYYGGARVTYRKGNVESGTKAYYTRSANDFTYTLPSSGEELRQRNAAYRQWGLVQDVNVRINSTQQVLINAWFTTNDRELQPVIGDMTNNDQLEDRSFRLAGTYQHATRWGYFEYKSGYLNDWQLYNETSEITTHQLINSVQIERELGKYVTIQTGAKWNHIRADVDAYDRSREEERVSAFLLVRYDKDRIKLSANTRQTFVTDYNAPFAPSLGIEYTLTKSLTFTGQVSRNYRVPTLNDRYWVPGGNRELRPELSYNAEVGLQVTPSEPFSASLNYYKMWVDDWIIWLPEGGVWSPNNINEVNAEGIEVGVKQTMRYGAVKIQVDGEYAYNRATIRKTFETNQRAIGEQLPYTPEHTVSLSSHARYKNWTFFLNTAFTGERYTDSNNTLKPLESYALIDTGLGRQVTIDNWKANLGFYVNNLGNKEYQTLRNRAMPARSYRINLTFNFNKTAK